MRVAAQGLSATCVILVLFNVFGGVPSGNFVCLALGGHREWSRFATISPSRRDSFSQSVLLLSVTPFWGVKGGIGFVVYMSLFWLVLCRPVGRSLRFGFGLVPLRCRLGFSLASLLNRIFHSDGFELDQRVASINLSLRPRCMSRGRYFTGLFTRHLGRRRLISTLEISSTASL